MICAVCDLPISKDEVRSLVFGEPIHAQCDITDVVDAVCDNDKCTFWRCLHSGQCMD